MVSAVALWDELGAYNSLVEQHFRRLSDLYEQNSTLYSETISSCAQLKSTEWHTVQGVVAEEIVKLVKDFNHVRSLLQMMSELSEVPVEPKEQTRLLDECTNVPGVAMAGVPGGIERIIEQRYKPLLLTPIILHFLF